ncbi:MFS transporter [Sphingomonas colocasiae]|uniref:MFS transporter n=1 Tax=Sphingomonas colocasiae TaxID=1848973 RepID=A0ABS7PT07_9SPHN|nr:MFS transporter [Sphingomonas colocasiae]MBY8824480.1 MFS transporter [Sphingomonas colocasiae]
MRSSGLGGSPAGAGNASIAARFERLPFTAYQRRIALILVSCFAIDAVDLAMLSYLLAPVSHDLGLSQAEAGLAASSVFAGVGIGATIAGILCDTYGRRKILVYTMYLWGVASLLTAFAWDLTSFMTLRFITGIGLGAEIPAAFALIAECMPASRRALITGWMQVGSAIATVLFNIIALVAIHLIGEALGWRAMFVLMFLAAMFAIYVRRHICESPRWLASCGRDAEAARAMAAFESEVERAHGRPLPPPVADVIADAPPVQGTLAKLFAPGQASRTLFAWALWFAVMMGYYGITMWVGKLLVDRGMSIADSIMIGIFISSAGIPAAWLTGSLMERLGRKLVIIAVLMFVSLAALAYGYATSFAWIAATGAVMRFFMVALATGLYAYTPELFRTSTRATGLGTSSTMGRISAVAGPMLVPVLVATWGYIGAFAAFAICFGISALLVLLIGPETRGKSVEDATA